MTNSRNHNERVKAAHAALPPEAELERMLMRLRRARAMLACSDRDEQRERATRDIHRLERELCIDVPGIERHQVSDKPRHYGGRVR